MTVLLLVFSFFKENEVCHFFTSPNHTSKILFQIGWTPDSVNKWLVPLQAHAIG